MLALYDLSGQSFVGGKERMARLQTERVHIALTPSMLAKLNSYRHIARVDARSTLLRQLVSLSLAGRFPEDHIHILKQVLKLHQDPSLPERKIAHVHIAFTEEEFTKIDRYRRVSPFETRSDIIRYLLFVSLSKNIPEEHLLRLRRIDVGDEEPSRPDGPNSSPPVPKESHDVC